MLPGTLVLLGGVGASLLCMCCFMLALGKHKRRERARQEEAAQIAETKARAALSESMVNKTRQRDELQQDGATTQPRTMQKQDTLKDRTHHRHSQGRKPLAALDRFRHAARTTVAANRLTRRGAPGPSAAGGVAGAAGRPRMSSRMKLRSAVQALRTESRFARAAAPGAALMHGPDDTSSSYSGGARDLLTSLRADEERAFGAMHAREDEERARAEAALAARKHRSHVRHHTSQGQRRSHRGHRSSGHRGHHHSSHSSSHSSGKKDKQQDAPAPPSPPAGRRSSSARRLSAIASGRSGSGRQRRASDVMRALREDEAQAFSALHDADEAARQQQLAAIDARKRRSHARHTRQKGPPSGPPVEDPTMVRRRSSRRSAAAASGLAAQARALAEQHEAAAPATKKKKKKHKKSHHKGKGKGKGKGKTSHKKKHGGTKNKHKGKHHGGHSQHSRGHH